MTKKKIKSIRDSPWSFKLNSVYFTSNDTNKMETGLHQHLPSAFLDELDFLVHMTCM